MDTTFPKTNVEDGRSCQGEGFASSDRTRFLNEERIMTSTTQPTSAGVFSVPLTASSERITTRTRRSLGLAAAALATVGFAGVASAAPVSVSNAGFEDPALAESGFTTTVTGWSTPADGGTFNPTAAQMAGEADQGQNVHWSRGGSMIEQTLGTNLAEGDYTLSVAVGDRSDNAGAFPGYTVQLGVIDTGTFIPLAADSSLTPASGSWVNSTLAYSATAGDANLGLPLAIRLSGVALGGTQVLFDDVSLDYVAAPHDVIISLNAESVPNALPDGIGGTISVPGWRFVCAPASGDCADTASGPRINAYPGMDLTISLTNSLDTPVSLVIPGQAGGGNPVMVTDARGRPRMQSLTTETAAGATTAVDYSWTNLRPGSYLIQSGTQQSLQVPMGLFGALVVGPATGATCTTGQAAYDTVNSCHDSDALLVFSEIDPLQNQRVADALAASPGPAGNQCVALAEYVANGTTGYPCTVDYNPIFFLVNGEAYSNTAPTAPMAAGTAGSSVLLRMLNAGLRSHAPAIVGLEMGQVAEDGNAYPGILRQQSETLLPAGKTLDALVTLPAIPDATYVLFDRMSDSSHNELPSGGMVAKFQVGAGAAIVLPPGPTDPHAVNDVYSVIEDTPLTTTAATGVLSNDVLVGSAAVVSNPLHGTLLFNADGSFSYTPYANYSGPDGFTYSATDGTNNFPAQVTLNVSFANDAPLAAGDGPYVNTIGTTITVDAAHGVLGNDSDPDGDTLTAVLNVNAGAPASVTLNPDGSFTYTGGTGGTSDSFTYHAEDGNGGVSANVTVELTVLPVANIALNVTDPSGTPVTQYRWTVEEDTTWHPNPDAPVPSNESLAMNFHKSYMPVVAQGCVGNGSVEDEGGDVVIPYCETQSPFDQLALDPMKHYYVSVLPHDLMDVDDAGNRIGHTIGGAAIPLGTSDTTVNVNVNNQPLEYAQIHVEVFEDNAPTNAAISLEEGGLGLFQITLEDAGGRYGISAGILSQDADGNPLTNAYGGPPWNCFGATPPQPGVILSCPDTPANQAAELVGHALIKNLFPGKYGVSATPPLGSTTQWVQTTTIEGTRVSDAWVKSGEPEFFTEFGPPGPHVFIGFVSPERVADAKPNGEWTVSGAVTNLHLSRPIDQTIHDSESYVALSHTRPWVGLNSDNGIGQNWAAVQATLNDDGTATYEIPNVPDGLYQLVVWDTYLDQVIAYRGITVAGGDLENADVGVFNWFTRLEHNVFLDDGCGDADFAGDGIRQDCELPIPEQNINLRWRDGSVYQAFPTDSEGFVPFDQTFPFFNWLIAEVDYARFKPTGLTVTVDGGGPVLGGDYPGLLNPQVQSDADGGGTTRTETGPVLTEGFQGFLGQTSIFDWGKQPYEPGENGGISGIVYFAATRAEGDPRLAVGEPWEPGIPRVKVRLYRDAGKAPLPIEIANASFENPALANTGFTTSVNGWSAPADGGTFNPSSTQMSSEADQGQNVHWSRGGSMIAQTLAANLAEGAYTLRVAVGDRSDNNGAFPGYQVQLGVMNGATFQLLAEDNNSLVPAPGSWLDSTVVYSATAGDPNLGLPLAIRLIGAASGSAQVLFDDVSLGFAAGGAALSLVAETETDSWDDNLPENCPGYIPSDPILASNGGPISPDDKCYDGLRNFNQARPAVFDGGYAFGATEEDRLPPGKYVVEVVPPPGYTLVKEEDNNVGFGDGYATASVMAPGGAMIQIVPDPATIVAALAPEPGLAQPVCVGTMREVPPILSLFPAAAAEAPFAGATRPLCDRKQVFLPDQGQAAADFFLYTGAPVAGHFVGQIIDDTAQEFSVYSPAFGEKWAPPFMPVSIRDHNGREISRIYSDQDGRINALVPSTITANMPSPSGYSPSMVGTCMNDPGPILDTNPASPTFGELITDPHYNPLYSDFCYTFQYMPGTTTYLDTPVLPVGAFPAGYNTADCAAPTGMPVIAEVNGSGNGPLVAAGGTLTITSMGASVQVPNPAYEGPLAVGAAAQKTILRDFGFGTSQGAGTVTIDGQALTVTSWNENEIVATVPAGVSSGQLVVTRDGGTASESAVTVTVSNTTPLRVGPTRPYTTIQAAIDDADAGDLILVDPGVYYEAVIMWKPVHLQGAGAGSTFINATKQPTESLAAWREKMDCLFGIGADCTVEVTALPNQPDGAAGFETEEGAAITVVGIFDSGNGNANSAPRNSFLRRAVGVIDGFSITGGDIGGGIYVNAYADRLVISNNDIFGNNGSFNGGIGIGRPFLDLSADDQNPANGRFELNTGLNIHHNSIRQNGNMAGALGAGGGVSIFAGTDNYSVRSNLVCGNFSASDGGGIGHYGLSDGGVIANNRIILNQSFYQQTAVSGGGISIAGEPPAADVNLGAGSVTIDSNLIQSNQAGAGHGGGIRTQYFNGTDVADGRTWELTIINNMIVNNLAGWSGAGISLQDTLASSIVNNTIAHNDSTATVAGTFTGNLNISAGTPAGISSEPHSAALDAVAPPGTAAFSDPTLLNNIIWQNRSFHYEVDTSVTPAAAGLVPLLSQTAVGECPAGANYWDLGVLGGGGTLSPRYSVLTTVGYGPTNTTADPDFMSEFCNGGRVLLDAGTDRPGPMSALPAVDEGGNAWIDVRFGPLVRDWSGTTWDYHIDADSSAEDAGAAMAGVPSYDYDGECRYQGAGVDIGADERPVLGPCVSPVPSLYFSTAGSSNPPGVNGQSDDADIYLWDGSEYSREINAGSQPYGLPGNANVDGFSRVDDTHFYMSFSGNITIQIPGPDLSVADEDVVYYNGDNAQPWSISFDGSAGGNNIGGTDLDAVSIVGSTLYFSTNDGDDIAAGPDDDADIYRWNGPGSNPRYTRVFDGSANGLPSNGGGNADIDGLKVIDETHFFMSFQDNVNIAGFGPVQDEDIVEFNNGTWSMYFDGGDNGLGNSGNLDIDALDLTTGGTTPPPAGETGAVSYAASGDATLTGDALSFGNQPGDATYTGTVTIQLTELPAVTFGTLQVDAGTGGRFGKGADTCSGATLSNVGDACTVDVTFDSTGVGEWAGALTVLHDGTGSPQTLALSGSSMPTVAFASASFGTLTATQLDFGNRPNNSSTDSVITITVTGGPVQFGNVSVSNNGSNRFSELNFGNVSPPRCQNTIVPAGGQCSAVVRFNQNNSNSVRTGTLTVNHNGFGGPLTLGLRGQ
jgi:hypothetical protein